MTSPPERGVLDVEIPSPRDTLTVTAAMDGASAERTNGDHVDGAMVESPRLGDTSPEQMERSDALSQEEASLGEEYPSIDTAEELMQEESVGGLLEADTSRPGSPGDSLSTPDDPPSVHGSISSSPRSSALASPGSGRQQSPTPSLRPFDRRFSSRLSSSQYGSPRALSPAFLNVHSRQSSISSILPGNISDAESPPAPWEVVRWTRLKKITGQAFAEAGKRSFGKCTCIAASTIIALGTTKGIVLIFDYHQTLKCIIGNGTKATQSGAITSIALSADHTTVAGGHANGSIFTWDIAKPARPFLQIPPMQTGDLRDRKSDGHVSGVAIVHLGFLGTRHTALVSADDRGMAFSHLATRGLGAAGRSVKTQRILGRYPSDMSVAGRPRKPSSVLAFSPLPIGNTEQITDTMGLVAMLTPYLLVIVSTTPIAQTQHKASRPREVAAHSVLSGCLAWFPSVKLKTKDPRTRKMTSQTKLVYCWSNILTVLEVEEVASTEPSDREKPPTLGFRPRSRWKADEAIVAVQWLGRSVLGVLTITQQLLVLEDKGLRLTDSFDLIQKHIFHQDVFSKQLQPVVERLDEEDDASIHGVVADAFYPSFRTYRGRIILLGFDDISIGSLSTWADRLDAQLDASDYIGAIRLATSYYNGDTDKVTISLPEDSTGRHALVKGRLLESISRTLDHTFGSSQVPGIGARRIPQLIELAEVCFVACISVEDTDFLFDEVYTSFEEGSSAGIFLEALEPHVLEGRITYVPPVVLRDLVAHYTSRDLQSRLEKMICQLNTSTMDIDQITTLCKRNGLYDALVYLWTQALGDYITPLVDLLALVTDIHPSGGKTPRLLERCPDDVAIATKMFPYLSYISTSRVYPTGADMSDSEVSKAKADLYSFLFSGKTIIWPKTSGKLLLTRPNGEDEPSFPYLRLMLLFDAPSFLEAMNEAFEDNYLNGVPETNGHDNGTGQTHHKDDLPTLSVNRQYIITILLEVMSTSDFTSNDTIYLDMFIARNLPKFPQFILLSGTSLHRIILGLCNYPSEDIADDCQLSVEYLMSMYHPPDIESLIPLFRKAGFYRVLKSIYKADKQYSQLLEVFFVGPDDQEAVFDCIGDCLRPRAGLTERQRRDVRSVIQEHARELTAIDPNRTATTLDACAPDLHDHMLASLSDDHLTQYYYLKPLLEPRSTTATPITQNSSIELYIRLLCQFDPTRVADYINTLQSPDLQLEKVLPALESSGVVDGSVVLLAREGQVQKAMKRLTAHLDTLESALLGLLDGSDESPDEANTSEAVDDVLKGIEKYTLVGIWLCQGGWRAIPASSRKDSTAPAAADQKQKQPDRPTHRSRPSTLLKDPLTPDEALWLDLIHTTVHIAQSATPTPSASLSPHEALRSLVQQVFTSLLALTSTPAHPSPSPATATQPPPSFLRILLSFLTTTSSCSTLSSLRPVLTSIFSTYTYETSLLSLAHDLLDADRFVSVAESDALRRAGWRAGRSACEGCSERVWGAGTGAGVWEAFVDREHHRGARHPAAAGKGKAADAPGVRRPAGTEKGPLVVFRCGHVFHRTCLVRLLAGTDGQAGEEALVCVICR